MISIITPHYNDLKGLKKIYNCLKRQSSDAWEWLVIDDFSDTATRELIKEFFQTFSDSQIQLIFNTTKTNASICRNIGIDKASHERLVFLDSDDVILDDFVRNRLVEVEEFVVYKNYKIVNEKSEQFSSRTDDKNPLDCFLKANFIWQTTSVLWKKAYLIQIGKFDPNLERLQDVELFIRALFVAKDYKIIDNRVDFFYYTKPIRLRTDIVSKSCASVNYLISKIHNHYTLNRERRSFIKAYYYACVKSLYRTTIRKDVVYLKESLKLFLKTKYINVLEYVVGYILLILYQSHMIPNSFFIKANRYFFK